MTGTWFLIGAAIGLTATIAIGLTATIAIGYWRGRRIYAAQLAREQQSWPAKSDGIYNWAHDWDQLAADELEGWQA